MSLGTVLLVWLAVSVIAGPICGMAMRLNERRQMARGDAAERATSR
jgi:hypothetical protein